MNVVARMKEIWVGENGEAAVPDDCRRRSNKNYRALSKGIRVNLPRQGNALGIRHD
jgi:hypothetical protein